MTVHYQQFLDYMFAKSSGEGVPLSGTFELTARCNLDCKMCYIHKRANDASALSRERTTEQWLSLAGECQKAGMLLLLLTGGEPFLRSDFKEIYSGVRNLGMLVSINTNATMLTPGLIAFLAKDPPVRINVTLYGASRETYEALCGDGSAYDRAIANILALQAAGIRVKLNCSVTPYNRADMAAILAFAEAHQLPVQTATYMFPPVRACENGCFGADRMTPEASSVAQLEYDRWRFPPEKFQEQLRKLLAGQEVPDPDRECQELPAERIRCRAGSTTFWVTYDGQMRPCGMMTEPSVSLTGRRFADAWQEIRKARQSIFMPPQCGTCDVRHACDRCAAMCYAETGSFTGVPTYVCKKIRSYLAQAEKIIAGTEKSDQEME